MRSFNLLAAVAVATLLVGCNQNNPPPGDAPAAEAPDVNVNVPPAAPDVNVTPPADAPDVNVTAPDAPDVNVNPPPAEAPPAQ